MGQDAPILQLDIFSGASRFVASEQEAFEHGGKGIIEFWRRLGLTFTPHGEGFYFGVAAPKDAWPAVGHGVTDT